MNDFRDQAQLVFRQAGKTALSWGDFVRLLAEETKLTGSGARKRMEKMTAAGILQREASGFYVLA